MPLVQEELITEFSRRYDNKERATARLAAYSLGAFLSGWHHRINNERDLAMAAVYQAVPTNQTPGGIDLTSKNMNLDVAREGQGIDMKFDPAMSANLSGGEISPGQGPGGVAEFKRGDFSGVVPVILRVTPIKSPLDLFSDAQ